MYNDMMEQLAMGLQASGAGDLPPNFDKALISALKAFMQSFGDSFAYGAWQADGFHIEGGTPFK
jgi:hypothetical protein